MNVDSPTRRRLLELVYDLLPPAEAAELRRRIDAEPELARAYEEARTTAGLFAEASRLPAEKLQLKRPEETMSTPTEPARPKLPTKPAAATDKRRRRGTWWAVGLAAAAVLMVTVSAGLYWSDWRQRSAIAAGHMRLQVTGPAVLQAAMPTAYTVRTTTVDGDPMPALVEVSLRTPQGEQLFSHSEVTDEQGRLKLTLATKSALSEQAVLHVVAKREDTGDTEKIETRLKVDPVTYAAHLSLDKPLYRPGETVYYRSLVLSRFGLAADRETILEFEILDPGGAVVADSKHEGVTEHGVGSGAFEIPAAAPGGEYTLVARSLGDSFLEQSRPFFVRSYRLPRLKKELEFARDSYAPGDEVVADFLAERAEGGAVAGARLEIVATVDGGEVFREPARADNTGAYQVKFTLPEEIARGDGQLNVIVDDGGTLESAVETIPINLGKVEVEFYPEGGDLAAALENRVYFVARDPLGEPVHVKGLVVNGQGTAVALAETTHEGMGSLGFTPLADETYRLRITSPAGVTNRPELPKVSTQQKVVLTTGTGVFGASDPLTFNVRSAESGLPLVVSAWCRGAQVGQQTLVTTVDGNGANANTVKIPLPDDVGGVIRLTVHDYSEQPPKPVAERLVYRRMARQLKVRAAEISERYSPGDPVNVSLMVTNEKDEPVPAVIGVAVVDDALLNLADDDTAAMNTHFLLTSEVENPEDLEDADFYLSGNRATGSNDDSAVALDLLLGTQGWRRFVEKTLRELEQDEQADEQRLTRLAAITPANPPLMYDNLETIRSKYEESLSDYQGRREGILNALITVGFVVGLGLVLLVVMLGLLKVVSGVRLWVPAVGVTVCCAIIGVILIEPAWRGSDAELVVAFKQFDMAPPEISPETSEAATEEEWDEKGGDWGLDGDEAAGAEMPIDMLEDMPGEDMPAADGELALPGAAPMPGKPDAEGERLAELGEKRKAERGGRLMMEREKGRERFLRVIDGKDLKQLGDLRKQLADLKFDADMDKDFRKELNEALERHRFVVREYAHRHEYLADEPDTRVDFAETLYWHPSLVADNNGMARISFELSDSVTMFRLQADAHGQQRIGSGGGEIVSKIPFSLEPKLPLEVTAGDRIDLPLAVANDTREPMPVEVTFEHGDLVSLDTAAGNDNEPQRKLELPAGGRAREYFVLNVTGRKGDCELTFRGTAQGAGGNLTDAIRRPLVVVPPGFPKTTSYSGQIDGPQELVVSLPEQIVEGSLEVTLNAFPSTLADLQKGMEGMLREPCGCFEQASTSNYPNVLSLQYMQDHDVANPAVTRRAKELLESGYVKLTGYECRQAKEGYEWFGSDPGHEALTAYGLMEFRDMAKVYDV
ncbi:MAG: hypothetical protein HQ567_15400, partial [Candidatus Nealsonbacteria bacterium]|nr:hypothetical protein [Candidatus Nealsonbacteria bacterium]